MMDRIERVFVCDRVAPAEDRRGYFLLGPSVGIINGFHIYCDAYDVGS